MRKITIAQSIKDSIETKKMILGDDAMVAEIDTISKIIIDALKNDKKILFCGNGGSAADAQHLAAELSGKFYLDRKPLFAEALHVNSSYITAVANDYSYDDVYSRLVIAKGRKGDILLAISTSGNSKNILRAIDMANEIGMITIGMTGEGGGKMQSLCKHILRVPSSDTPRIQEAHILLGHIICQLVEEVNFTTL